MKSSKLSFTSLVLIIFFVITALTGIVIYNIIETPVVINPPVDKYMEQRKMFIHAGLFITAAALYILIFSVFKNNLSRKDKLLNYFIFILIFAIAWKNYPYWANGLHHVFSGGTSSMYDPKDLVPYTEIGVAWSGPVLLFHLLIWLIIPVPAVFWILDIKKTGFSFKDYLLTAAILLIVGSFWLTPHYMYWFLD